MPLGRRCIWETLDNRLESRGMGRGRDEMDHRRDVMGRPGYGGRWRRAAWLAPLGLLLGMPSCKGPSRSADAGAHEEPWRGQVEALSRARSSDRLLLCDGQGQQCLPLESGGVQLGELHATWADGRRTIQRDDEIALELLRDHLAIAAKRFASRPEAPALRVVQ